MGKQRMPRAELAPRPTDVSLSAEKIGQLSLFAGLQRKPNLERFPGSLVLRRYRPGEIICQQGKAGWTAFYLLTSEDVLQVLRHQLPEVPGKREKKALVRKIALQFKRVRELPAEAAHPEGRRSATVFLTAGQSSSRRPGWLERLRRRWRPVVSHRRPRFIPFDGPPLIDFETRQATLFEGELFGEMSCLNYVPRSATVVADRELYVVEMLRNILDLLYKDPAFKRRLEAVYRQRLLPLRHMNLFRELNEEDFHQLVDHLELVSFEPGQVILDEYEPSDSLFVLRRGLVKVQKGVSAHLRADQVSDWQAVAEALHKAPLIDLLSSELRSLIEVSSPTPDPTSPMGGRREKVLLAAMNHLQRCWPGLHEVKALSEAVHSQSFQQKIGLRWNARKTWTEQETRTSNRYLLETLVPGIHPYRPHPVGADLPLAYCSPWDFLGEIGFVTGSPRSATCVAYGQRVELIRLKREVMDQLLDRSPSLRPILEEVVDSRRQRTREQLRTWHEPERALYGTQASDLGLVQGQRLMLIDLDRCTRCDECVQACVQAHGDGRSRLLLEGPRFGQYLVPTTCRSCRDPLCLVGCPVGSIHQGDAGQILIEDWCIGCGLCSRQCPYGAIHMHDLGIIPEPSPGWRLARADQVKDPNWQRPDFSDQNWAEDTSPFSEDRELRELLGLRGATRLQELAGPILLRHTFHLTTSGRTPILLRMVVQAEGPVSVWINGRDVLRSETSCPRKELWFPSVEWWPRFAEGFSAQVPEPFRKGRNVVSVQVKPETETGQPLLHLTLHEARKPESPGSEGPEMPVTHRAVTCDLCHTRIEEKPACVRACPHDAAFRLDGRFELPLLTSRPPAG